jgi:hypothetical protein
MKIKFLTIIFLLFITFSGFSQNTDSPKNTVQFIDSLAKTNRIDLCVVYAGGIQWGEKKHKFSFENNILILELQGMGKYKRAYYNMDKLVSFYILEDRMIFNFQR